MKAIAQTLFVTCKCGGDILDDETGSYSITTSTRNMTCDTCGSHFSDKQLPKTARVF